jgi:hypothetical protein
MCRNVLSYRRRLGKARWERSAGSGQPISVTIQGQRYVAGTVRVSIEGGIQSDKALQWHRHSTYPGYFAAPKQLVAPPSPVGGRVWEASGKAVTVKDCPMSYEQRTDQQPPANSPPEWFGQYPQEQVQQPYSQQQQLYPGQMPSARQPARTSPPKTQPPSTDIPEWRYPRKWWSFSGLPRRTKLSIAATIASGVLALIIIGVLALVGTTGNAAANSGPQPTVSATHTTGRVSGTPATAVPPTATTGQTRTQTVFAPVLGGTVSDFAQQYGTPQDPSNIQAGVWQQLTIAGEPLSLSVSTAPSQDSQDGELHVMNIQLTSNTNATWTSSVQQQLMAGFLPSDSTAVHQATNSKSEIVYSSPDLAATFNASLFKDYGGTQSVAAGLFSEQCFLGSALAKVGGNANSCLLTVGIY